MVFPLKRERGNTPTATGASWNIIHWKVWDMDLFPGAYPYFRALEVIETNTKISCATLRWEITKSIDVSHVMIDDPSIYPNIISQVTSKTTNLYKKIVGTQLTALSPNRYIMIYPYLFDPPLFRMDWEPPLDAMTPHEVELEAYTERLRKWTTPRWSWDAPPVTGGGEARFGTPVWRLKKHVWEGKKPENVWRKQ